MGGRTLKRELEKVISGGQTGADRAGLDAALAHGIPIGGYCPLERRAEDGCIPDIYPLIETRSPKYEKRTKMNVRVAVGTLVLNIGPLTGGTRLTVAYAEKIKKPCLLVQLDEAGHATPEMAVEWLKVNGISTLNVAGPREGKAPGTYHESFDFLEKVFAMLKRGVDARCSGR